MPGISILLAPLLGHGALERLRKDPPRRFIIKVGYSCNNSCSFCHSAGLTHLGDLETTEIFDRIDEALQLGAESILFSGGEPTMRSDLVELADQCRTRDVPFGLITNGRMLSYTPLLSKLLARGLEYAYVSLHGPQQIHDAITRVPGSFAQTFEALRILDGISGLDVTCNVVVVRPNVEHLKALVSTLSVLRSIGLKFSNVEPRGRAADGDAVTPRPESAAAAVSEAMSFGIANERPLARFGVDGFPHCLDDRFPSLQSDFYTHRIAGIREVDEEQFYPIDYANMSKPDACRGCLIGDGCRGSWSATWERFGTKFIKPVSGGVSNSFNYFPADAAKTAPDSRSIRVLSGEETTVYTTDTGDFSDAEVLRIRDALGQVYVQVDDAEFLDDFAGQLRKLRRTDTTRASGHGGGPSTPSLRSVAQDDIVVFEEVGGDVFGEAEAEVRGVLERVGGTTLDVGCGETRYGGLFDDKLQAGELTYFGVDPSPGRQVRELAEEGRITLWETGIESAPLQRAFFDWILVLRSHNHLVDLWTAYARLVGSLKWGGLLLVVDNVAFGVVRQSSFKERVAAIPAGAGIEHLRNDSAAEAHRFLRSFPLRLEARRDVTPATANQWLLLYRKAWPNGQPGRDTFRID